MTITLPLQPEEEARLEAIAHAKGVSAETLLREAIERILAGQPEILDHSSSEHVTGAALVTAFQASPYKDVDLEATRSPLPTRNVGL